MKLNMWRRKVEWDKEEKVYRYRGHVIWPLTWDERNRMPFEMQDRYYWSEIERIDNIIEIEEKSKQFECEPAEIGLNIFLDFVNGEIDAEDVEAEHERRLAEYRATH